jgi:hypothetical protein
MNFLIFVCMQLLLGSQKLSQDIARAAHQQSLQYPNLDSFTVLLRFGRTRLSPRLQIFISLEGILSLPSQEPALQDSKLRRQKMATLERKLVRFLLGLSVENGDFAAVLNRPLGK